MFRHIGAVLVVASNIYFGNRIPTAYVRDSTNVTIGSTIGSTNDINIADSANILEL